MPPSVGSDSTSGTVNGAGANQFLRCSPLVQASKTSSRGASYVRVTSISWPSPTAVLPVSLMSLLSLLLQLLQVVVQLVEPLHLAPPQPFQPPWCSHNVQRSGVSLERR